MVVVSRRPVRPLTRTSGHPYHSGHKGFESPIHLPPRNFSGRPTTQLPLPKPHLPAAFAVTIRLCCSRAPISIEGATDVSSTKNQATAGKRLLTIKELVEHLGATEWFWRTQIWAGRLPFVQIGRKMFIDKEDIEAFITRHKTRHLA